MTIIYNRVYFLVGQFGILTYIGSQQDLILNSLKEFPFWTRSVLVSKDSDA